MGALISQGPPGAPPVFPYSPPLGRTPLLDVDEPKISSEEVLVKIGCSGICFTDCGEPIPGSEMFPKNPAPPLRT